MADFDRDSMLEMFIFEISQLIDQLEETIIQSESEYNSDQINEIFRIMHTIKGSSAMMVYDNITGISHVMEDLFYYLREEHPKGVDYGKLSDYVLSGADFIKSELVKLQEGKEADGDSTELSKLIEIFLKDVKGEPTPAESAPAPVSASPDGLNQYMAKISFQDDCEMENIRAFTLVHNLKDLASNITHTPEDIANDTSTMTIRQNGFELTFSSEADYDTIHKHLDQTIYLKELTLTELTPKVEEAPPAPTPAKVETPAVAPAPSVAATPEPVEPDHARIVAAEDASKKRSGQSMISVNVSKLDALVNIMSELVMSEAMVTKNQDLEGLRLENFEKEARHLQSIITNLKQTVMSMRLVPVASTFYKMHRLVRDMSRQLDKQVNLTLLGEDTEVDKNIIDQSADPIMHIIRNSLDHGIESKEERERAGKNPIATVRLEARNSGSDVLIMISDDGKGIDTQKVLRKASQNGLLTKPDYEYTDKEIQQFIFLPGFSTNERVTNYSGRGVGMDVVSSNLAAIGGSVLVDSMAGVGTSFTLKIPLTLAIIEGMSILVAGNQYIIPISNIIKSFKAKPEDWFADPSGNEMVTVRGEIFNIVRLHKILDVEGAITDISEGTLIMLEHEEQVICLLVDRIAGQQQAVLKPLPTYFKKIQGIGGCTLLGNGDIALIVDVPSFFD